MPREISIFYSIEDMTTAGGKADVVVIIDVFGISAIVIAAFEQGIKRIVPATTADEAFRLRDFLGAENVLLCGEKDGRIIGGFDLGFTPTEIGQVQSSGKDLVLLSEELAGLVAIRNIAPRIYIGGFNNIGALADKLAASRRIIIFCAGRPGKFSIEDSICAGGLIERLLQIDDDERGLNDAAVTARYLYQKHEGRIYKMLCETEKGLLLSKRTGEGVLTYLSRIDTNAIVPACKADSQFFSDDHH